MLVMEISLKPLILSLVSSQIHLASCLGVPVFDPSIHRSVILEEFADELYYTVPDMVSIGGFPNAAKLDLTDKIQLLYECSFS